MSKKDTSDTAGEGGWVNIEDPDAHEPPVNLFARTGGFMASNQFSCVVCGNIVTVSKKKAQKLRKMRKPNVKCKRCKKVQKARRRR